jgi:hypothetical protein
LIGWVERLTWAVETCLCLLYYFNIEHYLKVLLLWRTRHQSSFLAVATISFGVIENG